MGETKLPPKVCEAKNETQNATVLEPQYEVWKPDRLNRALSELNQDDKKTVFLFRTVNSILNKVTPENFSKLEDKMKSLPIDTPTRMQGVVDIIHKKAIEELKFLALYAEFCNLLRDTQITNEDRTVKSFTHFLNAKCEIFFDKSFQKDLEFKKRRRDIDLCDDQELKKSLIAEYEVEEYRFRKFSAGNCYFVGELIKLNIIYRNKVFQMLDKLFEFGGNMAIECICAILTSIGQFYENEFEKFPEEYFEQINSLLMCEKLTSRIRFQLQNLLDLRNNCWCPRMQPELPKTLQQIDQDILDEANISEQKVFKNRSRRNVNKAKKNKNKFNKSIPTSRAAS